MVAATEIMEGVKSEKKLSKAAAKGWRSVLSAFKQQLKILSPVRCLAATRDSYVRGMNNFAASSTCGSMMVQGPHIAALSRNASRSVSIEDDDFYQLVRAASRKNAEFGDLGAAAAAALPRSASVQEQGSNCRIAAAQDHHFRSSYPRSASHSGISRFQVQKTILESTQEE